MVYIFVLRRVLLKCSFKLFVVFILILLLCNWLVVIFLFLKFIDFNFLGNFGMLRVMCVVL